MTFLSFFGTYTHSYGTSRDSSFGDYDGGFMAMQRGAARREGARSEEILHLGIMMVVCVSISVFISVCSLQLNSAVLDV